MSLASWAAPYVGLPYAPHGRARTGVDCYGLVALVLAEVFGIEIPHYAYAHAKDWGGIAAAVRTGLDDWMPIATEEVRPGDGVVLRLRGLPLHVGLVVDTQPLTMLHVLDGINTCCQRLDTPIWAPRVLGFYRWMRP
jgi:cell wall-associated NlpC family hydrolase